jgi:hypothetical protein
LSSAFLSSSFASVSFGRCRCFYFSVVAVAFLVVIPERNLLLRLPLWLSFRSAAEESAFAFAFAFVFALVLAFVVVF